MNQRDEARLLRSAILLGIFAAIALVGGCSGLILAAQRIMTP